MYDAVGRHAVCLPWAYALLLAGCNLPAKDIEAGDDRIPPGYGVLTGSVTQTSDGYPTLCHERALFIFAREGDERHPVFRSLRFKSVELSAGEVVYIGNLDAAFCIRHAYANQYGIAGVRLYVNDKSDRDIPLLREKFHALRNISIDRRVLNDSFMQQQLGYLSQRCSGEKKYTLDL